MPRGNGRPSTGCRREGAEFRYTAGSLEAAHKLLGESFKPIVWLDPESGEAVQDLVESIA
jgi:hypothetical protein